MKTAASSSVRETLTADVTHGIAQRSEITLLDDSIPLRWRSLYASLVRETPWSAELPTASAPGIAFCLGHSCRVTRTIEARRQQETLRPRQFSVLPAHLRSQWTIAGSPEILHLYVHSAAFDAVANDLFDRAGGDVELLPRLCEHDPVIEHIASTVLILLREKDPQSRLQADHLAYLLAGRLVSRHSNLSTRAASAPLTIAAHQWRRMLDFVEAHLAEDLSLEALASCAGMHPSHVWRAFRANLGTSPHRYVVSQRLERARHLLEHTADPLAEVALRVGFSSQSHLAAAFKKDCGMTPAQYRREFFRA